MRLLLSREATRSLRALPKQDTAAIYARLTALAADPLSAHPFAKVFGGGKGRVRQDDWRALYRIDYDRDEVVVSEIARRRERTDDRHRPRGRHGDHEPG
jgi:mRNA-degrading endonuclease RelE of RelBE toxin-antitoxin system